MDRQFIAVRGGHSPVFVWVGVLLLLSLVLVGCGSLTPDEANAATIVLSETLPPTPAINQAFEAQPEATTVLSKTPTPTPDGPSFTADIQPIFTERCIKCHSGDNPPRGLRLTDYENVLLGGTYRPVVIPGNPEESEMVKRIRGEAIPRMPFDGPPFLEGDQIALIEAWIADGALNN